MSFINAGAHVKGSDPKSKKALKEAIANDPESVTLYSTSLYDSVNARIPNLPDGKYSVTGPNPYDSRKWYATVEVRGGKAKVS